MKYTEEDIRKTLNFLRLNHPGQATREGAIKTLRGMQSFAKSFIKTLKKQKKKF